MTEQQLLQTHLTRALQLAQQLEPLHAQRRIHGGLHPACLEFLPDGSLRLGRAPAGDDKLLPARLRYAAPEQIGRLPVVDARCDLYTLGLLLYEWLLGQPAFAGNDALDLSYRQLALLPPPPHTLDSAVPQPVSDLVMRLLAKHPDARYASASALVHDLQLCLQQLREQGSIPPFALCAGAPGAQWRAPAQLFGRAPELAELGQLFQRAAAGEALLCSLSGSPGMGKTTLVRALRAPVDAAGGSLVEVPCQRYPREVPGAALVQALREQLPGQERLVLPATPAAWQALFAGLFKRCATRAHPLLLFVDDLQWADAAALALLHNLLQAGRGAHLLLVCAWGDDAPEPGPSLASWLDGLRQDQRLAAQIRLGPLPLEALTTLVEASCQPLHAAPELAALVLQKTGGIPFYAGQFLKSLVAEGRLYYDRQAQGWRWSLDPDQLRQAGANEVDLLLRRLKGFAPRTQQALRVAACMGRRFALHSLARVCGVADAVALGWLAGALQEEELLPLAHRTGAPYAFVFAHERVQQAASALAGAAGLPELQLRIGRTLWRQTGDAELEQHIFPIVDALNQARTLLTDAGERLAVAGLNLRAGLQAKAALAWQAAADYLQAGIDLLPARAWQTQHALSWELHRQLATCASALRQDGPFERSVATLLEQAQGPAQRSRVRQRQVLHLCRCGRLGEALALGRVGLAEAGLQLPPLEDRAALDEALRRELARFWHALDGRPLDEVLPALPQASDSQTAQQQRLIGALGGAATALDAPLLALLALLGANRALTHGNGDAAVLVYSLLGQAMAGLGDYGNALRLARVATRLAKEQPPGERLGDWARLHRLGFVLHWSRHGASDLQELEQAYAACRLHDPLLGAVLLGGAVVLHYSLGRNLSDVLAAHTRLLAHCKYQPMDVVLAFPQPCVAAAAALRGETPSLTTLSGAHMDETAFVQAFGPVPLAMGLLRAAQATLHGLAGNYEETLALAADPGLALSPPLCLQPALCFWRGLAALRLAAASQGERRSELLALGRECSDFLSQVTKQGAPDNVTHRIRMLRAERERAEGRTAEVAGTLQQAADLAARNGFVLEQGFCLESLGLWLLEDAPAGAAGPARASLQQAAQCYGQAQALLLQRRVEERLAALADSAPADSAQEDSVRPDPGDSGELERQLAARGQQVLQLQLELQQAREQLEQAARAKAGFLVSMGHEIRTPMNAIIGLSHLALKNAHDAQQRDYLNKIRQSGQQLLGVLNDILDFTKVEAGRLDMEIIPFELDTVFETLAGITAEKVNAKGLELFWQVAPDVPRNLIGDPLRLGQILINYTSNAIKFTERGEVGISVGVVEKDRDTVRLRFAVRDTGIGLSAQQAAQLFQSANPDSVGAMRKGGGAGLGLAICKRLAGLMGGEVGVHSTPGEGATFWFTATLGLGAQNPRPRLAADLRRKRVLVVDDNANAAAVLCEQLLVLGCKAHGLVSGHAALQEIRRAALAGEAYDVLMTDWQMPEMDGLELVGRVNASGVSPMPLKVLVTAYGKETAGPRAAGTGIAQVLQKPVSNAMLFDGLMALFGQEAPAPAFPAGAADIATTPVLDPVRGARILLVEDNESNQQVALELLTSENFLVELAVDGKQAVDRVNAALQQQRPFDLVLMDLQMPVMDGVAATRLIRSNPAHDMLPVVAMTANALQSDRQLCLRAGMNDFVAKPVEPRQLWAALVKWIAPRPGLGPEPAAGGAMTSGETAAALQSLRTHLERNDAQALEVFARLEGMLRDWVGAAQFRLVEVAMDAFELEQALELLQSAGVFSHPAGSR